MNRRTFIKKSFASLLALLGIGGGTYYYAQEIEPSMLKVHQTKLFSKRLPSSFEGFSVLQFSDTHVGFHYSLDQLSELIREINQHSPDMIVFTGDLVDAPNKFNWNGELLSILSKLNAPHGKFWVYGNHDHGGYGTEIVEEIMAKSGFTLLKNDHVLVERSTDTIALAGLDDIMLGQPDLTNALNGAADDLFTMLLVHEPDYADTVKSFPVDVQLSGHSHGGQVRIPFIGHVYTPAYAEKYVDGHYQISERLQLFVSRGIGTTRLPYRFLCVPEMTIYRLTNR